MIRGIIFPPNGSCNKAKTFAAACKALNLKHIRTKPYTPKTNGKAERFIQTALREWTCARATSEQRKTHLPEWTYMACCRFRGHEDKIVIMESEIGYDETEVYACVQDRGGKAGDGSGRCSCASSP